VLFLYRKKQTVTEEEQRRKKLEETKETHEGKKGRAQLYKCPNKTKKEGDALQLEVPKGRKKGARNAPPATWGTFHGW